MQKIKNYIFVIVLLLFCSYAYGQATTQGKDFWISFGSNFGYPSDSLYFQVRIVATYSTNVRLTFTETGDTETISLAAGSVYTRDLSATEKEAVYADWIGVSQKSLHIESDENVAVYAINLRRASTDATGILPVNAYDTSYFHISYYIPISYDGYVIVAIENNTIIYENDALVATLNKGEVFSNYFTYNNARHIITNKPVAYFTTNQCTNVPSNVAACDCLYEQLLPESSWGISFMVPVTRRGIERIRIYAAQDNTTITHSGGTVMSGSLNLNSNEYVELEIKLNEAGCYIESDKPVAVASFLTGISYPSLDYVNGDPAMAWIPSIDQFVSEITIAPFIAAGTSILSEHHILIVTSTADKNLTKIRIGNDDYSLSGGSWFDHPSGYSFYSMPLTQADESYSFKNLKGLAIMGYGLGDSESYYYLAGSALRRLSASLYVNDIHNQDIEGQTFCTNSVNVKAVVRYEMHPEQGHLRWLIDNIEETTLKDNPEWTRNLTAGLHEISMIVKYKNGVVDTTRSSFTIELPPTLTKEDMTICFGSTAKITVSSPDETTFMWYRDNMYSYMISQAASFQTNVLKTDTIFYFEATSPRNCKTRDSITIRLVAPPIVVAMDDHFICYGEETTLEVLQSDGVISWNVNTETVSPRSTQKYIVTASRPPCPDVTDSVTITVGDLLYIQPPKLNIYKPNSDYSQQLTTNAESPVFSIVNSSLPSGLSLSTTGIISGSNISNDNNELVSYVTIQLEDIFGCKTEKEYVLKKELFIPKIFTPNGDDINDFFMKGYEIVIFDRLGIVIFMGDDGWDGTYNGKSASNDIYFYVIKYKNENGTTITQTGYTGLSGTNIYTK
jgi:gliding motility-associated-like protein